MFEKNVGQIDRIIRVILGLIFAALGFYFFSSQVILAGVFVILAIVMFFTAAMGTCLLYSPFNINTNKV